MPKKYFTLIPLLLFVIACQKIEDQKPSIQTRTQYQRIISLSPSTTEILFALDLGERVVGVTRFCKYPPEAQQKTSVGGYLDPNYEAIAMLEPDVVILLPEQESVKNYLKELDLNFFTVNNKTVNDILTSIRQIGDSCLAVKKADSLIVEIKQQINSIRDKTARLPRPKVLLCIGRAWGAGGLEDMYFAGRNTFYDELIELAGGKNAFEKENIAYPLLSAEGIITMNPDIIIDLIPDFEKRGLSQAAVLKDWETVSPVSAYKHNRLYLLSQDYVFIPGPRFLLLLNDLVRLIHPEIDWNQK